MLGFSADIQLIKEKIMKKSAMSEKELNNMIQQRQEEFSGLINEAAAAYSIAKELGIEIESESEREYSKVEDLAPEMHGVNLKVKVVRVFAPREFEKDGRKGSVCNLLVSDESGSINLVLWNKDVGLVERGVIEKGDEIEILDACMRGNSESREVHLGIGGQVIKAKGTGHKITRISEVKDEARDIDVVVRVIEVGAVNIFEKKGRSGKVSSLLVGDKSGEIRLVLWDSNAELAKRVKPGDILKIENTYSKRLPAGIELHANWGSRVIINPTNIHASEVEFKKIQKFKIGKLEEGVECEVSAKIKKFIDVRSYRRCKKCDGIFISGICKRCSARESKTSYVVSALIEDETGGVNATFFDRNALKLLGIKSISEDIELRTIFDLKRNGLVGKELILIGKTFMNKNLNKLEFIVKNII